MNVRLLNHKLGNLLKQRNLLVGLVAVLLSLNFLQTFITLFKDERIVVAPIDVRQEFWVSKSKVSKSYLEEMALLYADLILETTPNGAAYRRDVVLRNSSASGYGALKAKLLEDEKRLKKEHLSTSFQPNTVKVDSNTLTVEIKGDLMRYVSKKLISQSRDTYRFTFEYHRGRLFIQSFELIGSNKRNE